MGLDTLPDMMEIFKKYQEERRSDGDTIRKKTEQVRK